MLFEINSEYIRSLFVFLMKILREMSCFVKIIMAMGFSLMFQSFLNGQEIKLMDNVQVMDYRGKGTSLATEAGVLASREGVLVIEVSGTDKALLSEILAQIKALHQKGYNRIGVILSDRYPEQKAPIVSFYVSAGLYAVINQPFPISVMAYKVYNIGNDAYEEYILPRISRSKGSGN
jgi:hypothetical protein